MLSDALIYLNLPKDQVNFLLAQLAAILFGLLFRNHLKPNVETTTHRHIFSTLIGVLLAQFCHGNQIWHLFVQAFVVYLALIYFPRQYVHIFVFLFSMSYLTMLHVCQMLNDYGVYRLDFTGGLMIATQKLSSIAFSYYDGMRPDEELTVDQKANALKKRPSFLEFFSYMFFFQGILAGPLIFYKDYIEFINGESIKKHSKTDKIVLEKFISEPSVKFVLIEKLLVAFLLGAIYVILSKDYPVISNLSPVILSKPIWYRFIHHYITLTSTRFKYYLAWVLAEAVNNASGLGFNGYDKFGNPKWDLSTNINIIQLETSTSVKQFIENWNIQTHKWFRKVAYERLPKFKTLGVFVLSALWHGLYPGYYLTFVLASLLVYSGRLIHKIVQPKFQKNKILSLFYSLISWMCAMFAINYASTPFVLLKLEPSIEFYNSWNWMLHVITILMLIVLPYFKPANKNKIEVKQNVNLDKEN